MVYTSTFSFSRMSFLFFWIVLLVSPFYGIAQSPGGVSTEVAWYKANSGTTLNGSNVSQWNDNSSVANNATQASAANQPGYQTNSINFNAALTFNGTSSNRYLNTSVTGFPSGNAARSVFFVATSINTLTNYGWIFGYGSSTTCRSFALGKSTSSSAPLHATGYNNCDAVVPGYNFWSSNTTKLGRVSFLNPTVSFFDAGTSVGTAVQASWDTLLGTGRIGAPPYSTTENWGGNVAEIIMYPSVLSAADAVKVESYLALKYGIHKAGNYLSSSGTVVWDATANLLYDNDVFGIAQDDASGFLQSQSNSTNTGSGDGTGQSGKGNIIINNPSSLANNGFLIVGHDVGSLTETSIVLAGKPTKRVQRMWKVQSTGNPGTVSLSFDKTGLTYSGQNAGDYVLLVDPTDLGNFDGGSVVKYTATAITGNKISFDTVNLSTGAVFTFQTLAVPTVQATDIVFSGTTSTGTSASWTNGDGSARVVFMHAGTTGSPLPIDLTTYTANPSFGGGTQIGLTGWYCVYKGTGTTVNISGLTASTSYQVMTLDYNGTTPGSEIYLTTVSTGNPATITTNTTSSTSVGPGGVITGLQLWLDASNGATAGGGNLTAWTDRTAINTFAVSATPPTVNNNAINFHPSVEFNNATATGTYPATQNLIGNTSITYVDAYAVFKLNTTNGGTIVGGTIPGNSYGRSIFAGSGSRVYTGNGNSSTFSSFAYTDFTNFHVFAMEKNSTVTMIGRLDATDQVMNNQGTFSSISFIPTIGTTNNNGNSSGWPHLKGQIAEVVAYSQSAGLQKINIESYLALKYGIHKVDNYVSSANTVIWDATLNALYSNDVFGIGIDNLSGLSQSISNSMNTGSGDGTGQSGKGNIVISNPTSLANNGFLVIGHNTSALAETDIIFAGVHSKRVQRIWKAQATSNPGSVTLSYDTTGLSYSGQSASDYLLLVDPTGLGVFDGGSVVKYTAALLTGNKATFNAVALPNGAVFTFQTLATPTVQATNIVFSGTTATTTTASWTNGSGSSRAVFMFAGTTGSALPIDLTAYTPNTVFGSGTQIGTTGWYCVYNGTGTTVNITGLTPLTTYQLMTVEYTGLIASQLYLSTISTGNPAGVTTLNNVATLNNLTISQGTLDPTFATGTTIYTANVANAVSSLTVTPTATDTNAMITVNGEIVISGNPSEAIPLAVGPNIITTVVTAQDGITLKTYTITINRTAPATIVTTGTVTALSTVYGTPSASGTFNVSGTDMLAGILVTAPSGFEVSTDNTTFTNTVTVGATGIIASTPVYIRLKGNIPAGNYLGDVALSSAEATTVNYAIVSSTVNKAALTITAADKTKTYGVANPALTVNYSGFVNGDTVTNLTTAASSTTTATIVSGVGTYPITPGGAVSPNYAFTYVNGNLDVTAASLTFTADDKTRAYGAANPVFTGTYDGFVNGDTESSITTPAIFNTVADATSVVGDYPIIPGGAVSPNYVINYVFGNLAVTKATLTITADAQTKIYGQANPTLTVSYAGFANGESVLDLTTLPTIATTAALASPVGTYPIVASGAAATNYTFNYVDASLTVTTATLTVTAVNKTKVYGDANPVLTVTYSGFANGETVASLLTPPTIATTAALGSPVGTYPIVASGGADPNYTFSYVDGTLTVTVATLTITAVDKTKAYGAANPTLTITYSGFVNGETELDLLTLPTATTTAVTSSPVGSYPIVVLNGSDPNYTFNYIDGTLSVTPVTLTITAENKTKIYGDANPTLTVSYAGFVNGDSATNLTTAPTITTTAATASAVGSYPIVASAATDPNYVINFVDGTLTVTQATLTITADDKNKVYGDANPALTISYAGFVNGETVASLLTPPTISTTATTASSVGTYPITVTGASDSNYIIDYVNGTLTISATTLLTIVANNQSKTYGDANPALTVSYVGFVNGDTEADLTTLPTITTTAIQSSPAGTYPITASGAVNANYTIAYTNGVLTVNPAVLTVTADAKNKVYGDANPALTVTYSGFVNGDSVTSLTTAPTITTTADATSSVGTYPITASGAVNPNYTFNYVPGNLEVTAATLTITAENKSKAYADVDPTLTVSYSGFVNGDSATSFTTAPTITTTATTASPVGTYPITASGAVNSNYTINYINGTLTITPVALTITADNKNKVYGDANPTLTVSYTGFVNGDTVSSLTTAPIIATTADATSAVGTYPITASGAVNNNYTITYNNGTLTVNPAALTITADAQTKVYGAANPFLTVSYTGFVNGDTFANLSTPPTITTTADATSPVGTYPITAAGAVNDNYVITYAAGTLTVTPAVLTVTVDAKTKVYGDVNPAFTATYSGFVNSQTESDLLTLATFATTATAGSPVGTYPIVASGAADPNYTFNYVDGNLTITAATLTVTADAKTKIYGDTNPILTATYSGFVNGETESNLLTLATITTTAVTTSPVGTYPIVASAAVDPNYTFNYVAGILNVTPVTLTITADNQTKGYGDANPTLTVSYSGFVNGDSAASLTTAPTIVTTADATSPVGTYPITASGAVDANYTFNYVAGILTISPVVLTVTADNQTKGYGDANPTLTVSYSGFVNGDSATSLTTAPTIVTTADAISPVGTYPITVSGAVDANYTFNYVAGTLTISPVVLTVTADNQTKPYGDANPTLTVSYSGFVNGDSATSLTTAPTIVTTADATSPVGTYPITASGAVDANYTFNYVAGTLTVTPVTLTITADNQTKSYGDANPTLTVSYSGFVNGDSATSLTTAPSIVTTADVTSPVGTYPITASGAVDANYTFNYVAGILTVTPATLTVTADNQTRDYGEANPTLTATYSGFVNGDSTTSLTTLANVTTTADITSPVGTYPITAIGAAAINYIFNYVDGILTVMPLTDATLSNLSVSEGTLTPVFAPGTTSYTVDVANAITSITVTPVTNDADATVTVNGISVISRNASGSIALLVGTNLITVEVTAQDGTTIETYTITVNRTAPPTIVTTGTLSALTTTYGTASASITFNVSGTDMLAGVLVTAPSGFEVSTDGTTFTSTVTVGAAGVITSTPVYVRLNGTIAAGSYSGDVVLTSTSATTVNVPTAISTVNPAILTITANDASRTYGAADPTFTTTPTGFVNGDTASIITTQATATSNATATSPVGNSYIITPSGAVLSSSNYTIAYVNGTLTITALTDASLASLTISEGTLTPVFATGTTSYTATVANAVTSLIVTPTTTDATATVTVNGTAVNSGSASGVINLAVGSNVITTIVTAQDGTTIETYTVTVTRTAAPTIVSTGILTALTTTYGTASASTTFNVSGTDMLAGVLVTAPSGFEVSTDGTTFTNTVTVGAAGAITSTPVYVRLKGDIAATTYSGDVVLTSTSATTVNVPTATSTVSQATLTITANDASRAYGAADPAFTTTPTGFVNGDTVSIITTQATATSNATATSPVGNSYIITPSGAVLSSSNYTIAYVNGNLEITTATLTITADDKTKIYGEANPTFTFSYLGFVNGDTVYSLTTPPVGSTTADATSPVGIYPITISGATSSNYTIGYTAGATLSITPANLAIKADDKTKIYGDANPAFTFSYLGFVNGDTVNSLTTPPVGATTADATSPVGIYPITISGATSSNYTIGYTAGATLSITPANLAIKADDKTKIYGDANPAFTFSYIGFVNGDTVNSLTTPPVGVTTADATSPVGVYPITISGATSSNYTIGYTAGSTLSITPANLAIKADDKTKIYGEANPAFTFSYLGFVNGDTVNSLTTLPVGATTADATSPVGIYPITISGATSSNYTIGYTAGATLSITPLNLAIAANDQTKIYGEANPVLTLNYTGFVNGDTQADLLTPAVASTTADATSPVGVYPITISGATSNNYTIGYTAGATLTVTPATLTVTANNQTRDFGEANPILTAGYTGFVNGDTVASITTLATVTTTANTTSPPGTYPITASGAVATNYIFSYVAGILTVMPLTDATLSNLTISEGTLTPVFASGTTNYTAEVSNAIVSVTITPVTNDADATVTVNGVPVISGNASGAIPLAVGSNTITVLVTAQDGTTTETYTITVNRTAPPTIVTTGTFAPLSTTYGTASTSNTFNVSGTDMLSGILVTAPSGFEVSTDGITFTNTLTVGAAGTITSTPVYIRLNGTIPAGNYSGDVVLTSASATTVNLPIVTSTVNPAVLTITAIDATRIYGAADPAFSTTVAGFVNGDTNAIITTAAIVTSNATITSPTGNYALIPSGAVLSSSNYTIVYINGNLTITTAILTITADAQTKTYGAANPTLTASYGGFVNGDTAASLTTAPTITTVATTASSVGNYIITVSGAVSSNYTFNYVDGNLAVTPAPLIITADNQTKVYGSPNPTFTSTYTGFVNGDTASSLTVQPVINTPAVTASPVGTYPITDSGAVNPNYTISYVSGNLTVTAAPLTITADNKTRAYGAANPPLTASYAGFVNGETVASLTTPPTISTIANVTSPVGVYAITVSGAVDSNYAITYVTGVLTVTSPSDVNLASLTISNGVLTPAFSPNILSYNVNVSSTINTETITVVADDPLAKITINGNPIVSGSSFTVLSLLRGVNTFTIKVTSEDGSSTKTYVLTITKEGADDASLSNLTISKGILEPKFKSDITNYDAVVRYDVNSITVTPTATDSGATITVNGIAVTSNTTSTPIVLLPGENIIETVVTAEDGITKEIYAIVVYKGLSPDALVITNILSPNGDGKNDFWVIKDIELFPNNKVTVYDRAGRIVYSKNSYSNEWDGSYGGSPLNNDTYYYLIDLGEDLPKIKGFITMIRD